MNPGREESILKAAERSGMIGDDQLQSCLNAPSPLKAAIDAGFLSEEEIDGLKLMGSLSGTPSSFNPSFWDDIAGKTFGRYELVSKIGEGATALVIRARDPRLGRDVALKILRASGTMSQDYLDRFLREARAMAKLRHPSIVAVHEVGQEQGWYFLAMDFVSGSTFDTVLRRRRLGMDAILEIMEKVARAGHYAHTTGVIHRDLKPENILLDDKLNPYLTDFGLARLEEAKSLTQTGTVMGTPTYMSPEHLSGKPELIDARSDVYSLGVMLYEAATGKLPFDGDSVSAVYTSIQQFQPVRPRSVNVNVGRDLEAVIVKAMEREPSYRYANAEELAHDLLNVRQGLAVKATQVSTFRFAFRRLRRHIPLVAAVLLLAIVVAGLQLHSDREKASMQAVNDAILRTTRAIEQFDLAMVLPPTEFASKNKELDECIRLLSNFSSERSEHYFELGRALSRRQKYVEAVTAFDRALEIRNDHEAARFERARTLIDDYLDHVRNLPAGTPPEVLRQVGRQNKPLLDKAIEDLQHTTDQKEYAQALVVAWHDKPSQAFELFQKLRKKLDPGKNPTLYGAVQLDLGGLYFQSGRYREAADAFRAGLKVQQSSANLLVNGAVAVYLHAMNDRTASKNAWDESEALLREAIKVAPDSFRVYNAYGNLMSNRFRLPNGDRYHYTRAMECYEQALRLASDKTVPTINRAELIGYALHRSVWTDSFDAALSLRTIEEMRTLCHARDRFLPAHLILSSLLCTHLSYLSRAGRWDEKTYGDALEVARKAVTLDPRVWYSHYKMVMTAMVKLEFLRRRGSFDEPTFELMLDHARRAAAADLTSPEALHAVSLAAFWKPENDALWSEGLSHARKALDIRPDYKEALLSLGTFIAMRGVTLVTRKQLEEGERALRKVVDELDSSDPRAWNSLGIVLLRQYQKYGDDMAATRALESFDHALARLPTYAEATNNKGLVYFFRFLHGHDRKDLDRANELFNKTVQIHPYYAAAYQNRAELNEHASVHFDTAADSLDAFQKYLAIVPHDIEMRFRYARMLSKVDSARAEQEFERVLRANPQHARTYLERGRLRERLERIPEALADLNQAVTLDSRLAVEAEPAIQSCKDKLKGGY